MKKSGITVEKVIDLYGSKGYTLFTDGDYNLNIFGIRADEDVSNKFNDFIGVLYKEHDSWKLNLFEATTDPGLYYRVNPMNSRGAAILKEGYYKDGFKVGYHKGKYLALVQNKPFTLYRDNNKDGVLDRKGTEYSEVAGINLHHASFTGTSENVDKWSAGCQVMSSITDWNDFMWLIKKSSDLYGDVFSYALFNEKDLV